MKMSIKKRLVLIILIPFYCGCSTIVDKSSNPEITAFYNHLERLKDKPPKAPSHEYEVGNLSCKRGGITMKVNAGDYHYVRLYAPCFSSGPLKFTERGRKEAIDLLSKARSLYFRVYTANASVPTLIEK
jgi:hypothetical protein